MIIWNDSLAPVLDNLPYAQFCVEHGFKIESRAFDLEVTCLPGQPTLRVFLRNRDGEIPLFPKGRGRFYEGYAENFAPLLRRVGTTSEPYKATGINLSFDTRGRIVGGHGRTLELGEWVTLDLTPVPISLPTDHPELQLLLSTPLRYLPGLQMKLGNFELTVGNSFRDHGIYANYRGHPLSFLPTLWDGYTLILQEEDGSEYTARPACTTKQLYFDGVEPQGQIVRLVLRELEESKDS